MKGKGFDKLRGSAVAGIVGLGSLAGAGTARATWFAFGSTSSATPLFGGTSTANSKVYFWSWAANTSVVNPGLSLSDSGQFTPCGSSTSCLAAVGFAVSDMSILTWTPTTSSSTLTALKSDLYDGAFQVAVAGVVYANPDGAVDITGVNDETFTTHAALVSGLSVTVQMTHSVGTSRPGALRVLYSFTNNGASSRTRTINIGGNLGSDSATTVQATDDGDRTIEAADKWYITNDNTTVGGDGITDPVFLFVRHGTSPAVSPTTFWTPGSDNAPGPINGLDFFGESFELTVPAGATRRILLFAEGTETLSQATSAATSYGSVTTMQNAGLLNGLSDTVKSEIVNFNLAGGGGGGGDGDGGGGGGGGGGALGLGSLLGLLGLAGLRRRKGK